MLSLKEQRADVLNKMKELDAKVKGENRSMSDEEKKSFDEMEAQIRAFDVKIEAEERDAKLKGFSTELPKEGEDKRTAEKEKTLFRAEKNGGSMELRTNMSQDDGGAAIAPEQFVAELEKDIAKEALVYARVKKIPVSGAGSLGLPYEKTDASEADWTAEIPDNAISEDSAWKFGKRSLSPTDLTKLIKVSRKLLATSAVSIDTLAREKIAEKLSASFENAIVNGTGSGQPLGLFTASDDGIPTSRDVSVDSEITADGLIEAYMSIRPVYRKNAVWIMNTAILKDVMKLKGLDGQYIWQESLRIGEPSTILGLPVIESEYAPTAKTSGSYVAVLGDLNHYQFAYWKGLDVTVANEVFAGKNQVGFYGHTLADGCPTLPQAFARVKIGD